MNLHAVDKTVAPFVIELKPYSCWLFESKTWLRDVIQWHKIDVNFLFVVLSVPQLKETLRNAHRPYVRPLNLVSVFERSRYCIVRVCGVARGSHVGYKPNLLRCGDFWLFTAGCKDVTTGLLSTFIGFFVVLGYRLQNIDCAGRVRRGSAWNIPATWRPRTLHIAGCVERKTPCVSEACGFFYQSNWCW